MKYLISLSIYFLFATPAFSQFDFLNQPPTIDKIKDFTTFENSGAQKIVLTGISPGKRESDKIVTIKAFSNNLNLINHPKIDYDQSTTAVLFFTPNMERHLHIRDLSLDSCRCSPIILIWVYQWPFRSIVTMLHKVST